MSTNNLNLPAKIYTKQYRATLETVFGVEKAFARAFQPLQVLDGIKQNAVAFTVKTNNTPVIIGEYVNTANVGMGTGTAKTSRFGDLTEIIYTDTDVPYDQPLKSNDGFDITTVNENLDDAVAARFIAVSQAQTRYLNAANGAYIADVAGNSAVLDSFDQEDVLKLFNEMAEYYTNKEVVAPVSAYVRADLYNAIVDHPLVSSGKGSAVNIDKNRVIEFKDFRIQKEAERYFEDDDVAYFVPDGALIPFVGIVLARTIESPDFAGLALQTLGKAGRFILDDNKVAVSKISLKPATTI